MFGREYPQITLADTRLDIKWGESWGYRLQWSSIDFIAAYKRDCWGFDVICLSIEAGDSSYYLDEDSNGFKELLVQLPNFLPGALTKETWWRGVAVPAFAECYTEVYNRSGLTP